MRGMALETQAPHAPPAPGARRLPPLEHPVPPGRGLQRARPLARRMGRRGRRRHLPRAQLSVLLAAALGEARGRVREAVAALLGALPRALGRRGARRGGRALHRLPRPRDGEPALVPGPRCRGPRKAFQSDREHAGRRALRPGARERVLCMSFAVWLTGLPGSGKSAIARELVRLLHERGVDVSVLESDVMRTQLTPFPRYDDADRNFFYSTLGEIGFSLVEKQ